MKKFLFGFFAASLLFSCSHADEPIPMEGEACSEKFEPAQETYPQTWKLVKMTGSMINSETTGTAMAWQEAIFLKADNTFTKTRTRENRITEVSGTYAIGPAFDSDPAYARLTLLYAEDNDLIGSCQSVLLQETYVFKSKCKLTGTWAACDGPGLEYARQTTIPIDEN